MLKYCLVSSVQQTTGFQLKDLGRSLGYQCIIRCVPLLVPNCFELSSIFLFHFPQHLAFQAGWYATEWQSHCNFTFQQTGQQGYSDRCPRKTHQKLPWVRAGGQLISWWARAMQTANFRAHVAGCVPLIFSCYYTVLCLHLGNAHLAWLNYECRAMMDVVHYMLFALLKMAAGPVLVDWWLMAQSS